MIATCPKCKGLFAAVSAEEAQDPARQCHRCRAFESLLQVAEELVAWRTHVDFFTQNSGPAIVAFDAIVARAEGAASLARSPGAVLA